MPRILLFQEEGFPTSDSAAIPPGALRAALGKAGSLRVAGISALPRLLDPARTDLLVLPCGSCFPKEVWEPLLTYLRGGGNLFVLGGRPFAVPVRRSGRAFRKEAPQTAYFQELGIDQISETPRGAARRTEASFAFPRFSRFRLVFPEVHALNPRFAEIDEEDRHGAVGPHDGVLLPVLHGISEDGHRVCAPAVVVDRPQGRFAGGRWVFLPCRLPRWGRGLSELITELARTAALGCVEARVWPQLARYTPGARPVLEAWVRAHPFRKRAVRLDLRVFHGNREVHAARLEEAVEEASLYRTLPLPVPAEAGLHRVEAEVSVDGFPSHRLENGFWGWDGGEVPGTPRIGVSGTRFLRDGEPFPVVGTTYMAGDVSRKFHTHPNPARWDRDLAEMRERGITLIRTGLWAAHRQLQLDPGAPQPGALAALDAFVLCCAQNRMPVIFNLFTFIPDHWPGDHPYLDPREISAQREFLSVLAHRWAALPHVMWDLINEPSVTNPNQLWKTRPLPGRREEEDFRRYLQRVHGDLDTLRERWNRTPAQIPSWGRVPLPAEEDFDAFATPKRSDRCAPAAYDFHRYSQDLFRRWTEGHVRALRKITPQLVCVGQDEGGLTGRPAQHLCHESLDFACNHTWWEVTDLLWGNTAARVKGKPFLAQETGIMFSDGPDRAQRCSEAAAARLLERKCAASFLGAGFLQWCWNVNPYMTDRNEAMIGAYRVDGSARLQGLVLSAFGAFFREAAPHLAGEPAEAELGVVQGFTGLFNPRTRNFVDAAQRACHRVLGAHGVPFHTLGENEPDRLTGEKVVWMPSCLAMEEDLLSRWIRACRGRTLVVTGPLDRDGWWGKTRGLSDLGVRELRVPVEPEERVALASAQIAVPFGKDALGAVDKDAGIAARIHEVRRRGVRLLYIPVPFEAGGSRQAAFALSGEILRRAGVRPAFTREGADAFEVTVVPRRYRKAVLYLAWNEGARDRVVRLRDGAFGFRAVLEVPAGGAALAVFDSRGRTLARYRPPKMGGDGSRRSGERGERPKKALGSPWLTGRGFFL